MCSLYATAMTLADEHQSVTFCSCDLLMIPNELSKQLAESAAALGTELVVSATHTHSGPGKRELALTHY